MGLPNSAGNDPVGYGQPRSIMLCGFCRYFDMGIKLPVAHFYVKSKHRQTIVTMLWRKNAVKYRIIIKQFTVKQQIINILFPHLLYYKKNERRRHTSKKGTFDQKTD